MLQFIRHNRQYINILALWFVVGYLVSPLLYVLVPATLFTLSCKNKYLILFLGFWVMLVLSDARGGFSSAATVKILYLLILSYFTVQNPKILHGNTQYKSFIPFMGLALVSLISSPVLMPALQKTVSYFLIIFIVPPLVSYLLKTQKKLFLLGLVYTGAIVLFVGFVMRIIDPSFATLVGRYSGLFGNPNGLGIFSILFTMLWLIIRYYYPGLFQKKDKNLINVLIFASVLMAASRGALLSVIMFYALDYSVRKRNPFIVMGVILVFVSFMFMDNIVDWLYSIGLGEYLRAQTLEKGSGRIVAFEFAWEEIKNNPILGKGFDYDVYWFILVEENQQLLSMLDHQGGTHNSFLSILMNTGFVGMLLFVYAYGVWFYKAISKSRFGFPVLLIVLFSANVEAWLSGSLNPFSIVLIIILTLLSDKNFIAKK